MLARATGGCSSFVMRCFLWRVFESLEKWYAEEITQKYIEHAALKMTIKTPMVVEDDDQYAFIWFSKMSRIPMDL